MNYTEELDGFINRLIEKTKEEKIKWEMIPNSPYRFRAIINERDDGKKDQIVITYDGDNGGYDSEKEQEVIKDIDALITIGFDKDLGEGEIDFGFSTRHFPYSKYREELLALYSDLEIRFDFEDIGCDNEEQVKKTLSLI